LIWCLISFPTSITCTILHLLPDIGWKLWICHYLHAF